MGFERAGDEGPSQVEPAVTPVDTDASQVAADEPTEAEQTRLYEQCTGTDIPDLTWNEAFYMMKEMIWMSERRNVTVSICIRDRHDNLVAHIRTANALLGSVSLSCEKARSTALFMAPSGLAASFPGLELSNGIISPIQGAWPIMTSTGVFLGSIGVSGAPTGAEDEEIAKAGASLIDMALGKC